MTRILVVLLAIVLVYSLAPAQSGWATDDGANVQGTANMLNTKHDLRPGTSKSGQNDSIRAIYEGASASLCAYCHTPHVPTAGAAVPLWARKIRDGAVWGKYESYSLQAATVDPSDPTGGQNKNESNMCLSCHDGSYLYTTSAYEKRPHVSPSWTTVQENKTVHDHQRLIGGTKYNNTLTHTHPVNFVYADAVTADGDLYAAVNTKWVHEDAGLKIGRLFNGKVQCSSCHNPHKTDTKMLQGTTTDGKLCVACHKK